MQVHQGNLSGRTGNQKFATNPFCEYVANLSMTRNGFRMTGLRVLPKCVLFAFSAQDASMLAKMAEECLQLHPITTSSCLASGGRARKDSSRRCCRMRAIASRRFDRHSSRDFPWPLAPGTSAQYAMGQGPSRSTMAVNSLCMGPFYRPEHKVGVCLAESPDFVYSRLRMPEDRKESRQSSSRRCIEARPRSLCDPPAC